MTKPEITKLQRNVLEAAARRNDYAAWPVRDAKLNIGSATRVMKELIRRGLVIEKPAAAKTPIWREDGNGRQLMAIISPEGLAVMGMLPVGKKVRSYKGTVAANKTAVAGVSQDEARRPRPGTKLATLVELLERKDGATIAELSEAVGWQAHSTRGVLSGMLKRQFGLQIASEQVERRGRVYRLHSP